MDAEPHDAPLEPDLALAAPPATLRGAELLRRLAEATAEAAPAIEPWRGPAVFPLDPPPEVRRSARRTVRELLRATRGPVRAALVACLLYLFVFNFSVVRGHSMAPGIHDGDRILIDQVSHHLTGVARGDVVVLRYPLDPRLDYIKRVVGLPGDDVSMFGGAVWVNGELLVEPYVADPDPSSWTHVKVEPGHVFVLGDNRPHSSDSREFGQVPLENLRGRVDLRVWPPERFGWIR